MKDDIQLEYADRTLMSTMKELDEQREARHNAEDNLAKYQRAFEWLEKQEWFQNQRHTLTAFIRSMNDV